MRLTPLRVVAQLDEAVVASAPLHLDALLARAQALRVLASARLSGRERREDLRRLSLPLSRLYGPDGRWVWAASSWTLDPETALASASGESGEMVVSTPSVSWCCIGNAREILKALQLVREIGADRRAHGAVRAWTVEPREGELPLPLTPDGRLTRSVPWSWVAWSDEGPQRGACEPPYWHPALQEQIAVPGQRVRLRPLGPVQMERS